MFERDWSPIKRKGTYSPTKQRATYSFGDAELPSGGERCSPTAWKPCLAHGLQKAAMPSQGGSSNSSPTKTRRTPTSPSKARVPNRLQANGCAWLQAVQCLRDPHFTPRFDLFEIKPERPSSDVQRDHTCVRKSLVVHEKDFYRCDGDVGKLRMCEVQPTPRDESPAPEFLEAALEIPLSPRTLFDQRCRNVVEEDLRDPWKDVENIEKSRPSLEDDLAMINEVWDSHHFRVLAGHCDTLDAYPPCTQFPSCPSAHAATPGPPQLPAASARPWLQRPTTSPPQSKLPAALGTPKSPLLPETPRAATPGRLRIRRSLPTARAVPPLSRSTQTRQSPEARQSRVCGRNC